MNNKNQRIAAALRRMSLNFSNISRDMMEINGILLEKDSVPASTDIFTPEVQRPRGFSPRKFNDRRRAPPSKVHWPLAQSIANYNKQASLPHTFSKLPNEKSDNAVIAAYEKQAQSTTLITRIGLDNSLECKRIGINSTTIFYKRVRGPNRGSVLSVNRKTNQITDHKYLVYRYTGKPYDSTQHALVSNDADGLWYVKNVIRPLVANKFKGENQIVRYYRPNRDWRQNDKSPFTHCAIYRK